MFGSRVTDAVDHFRNRGNHDRGVHIVRIRRPDRFRWRMAVGNVTSDAGQRRGMDRMRLEEPIRELVIDLDDKLLRREVILDARRRNVDLDRGEVLPRYNMKQLKTFAEEMKLPLNTVMRYVTLPGDEGALVDTAGVVVVGRALADHHRRRAQHLWRQVPDADPDQFRLHHHYIADRARRDGELSRRWTEFSRSMLSDEMVFELESPVPAAVRQAKPQPIPFEVECSQTKIVADTSEDEGRGVIRAVPEFVRNAPRPKGAPPRPPTAAFLTEKGKRKKSKKAKTKGWNLRALTR